MIDHSQMKLGKLAPRPAPKKLTLTDYARPALPKPPAVLEQSSKVPARSWGMMLNDTVGDCTCAAAGHGVQLWTAENAGEVTIPDSEVLAMYEAVSGYRPGHPDTDNGAQIADVLDYWRDHGFGGRKLSAHAPIHVHDHHDVKLGIWLFGWIDIGVNLPISCQNQPTWAVTRGADAEPGSWGGHSVIVTDYDREGLTCITWGQPKPMTWGFFAKYCDEAHIALGDDWFTAGKSPCGLDVEALQADINAL